MFDIYFKSVGRGAALDLGIAPDKHGVLNKNDVEALKGFGKLLKETFSQTLLEKASIEASDIRARDQIKYGPENVLDGDPNTYWATDDSVCTPNITIKLNGIKRFNIIKLKEYIALGKRIESFAIDAWLNNGWKEIAQGTSIGAQRLLRLPYFVNTDRVRLRIVKSPVCPVLSEFVLFAEPNVSLNAIIKTDRKQHSMNKEDWKVLSAPGSQDPNLLLDGKESVWEGSFNDKKVSDNTIIIDMAKQQEISGIVFTPPAEAFAKGLVDKYLIATSDDGRSWNEETTGELGNLNANPIPQFINLQVKIKTRYIKFVPLHVIGEGKIFRIMEIGAY